MQELKSVKLSKFNGSTATVYYNDVKVGVLNKESWSIDSELETFGNERGRIEYYHLDLDTDTLISEDGEFDFYFEAWTVQLGAKPCNRSAKAKQEVKQVVIDNCVFLTKRGA